MTFREIRESLFARGRFGIKPGLDTIRLILGRLGSPQENIPVIHVAGTNGKGSTAAFLAAILTAGGYRAALFTSPHLISYTERFRIDGSDISEDRLVQAAEQVLKVAPADATFFELTTAIAFRYFADERVDVAVMEAGMGGRFDATNAVDGILSVITPVSLDHSRYLGSTLKEIAAEKAGIITGPGPVVGASQSVDAVEVISKRCQEFSAPLYLCDRDFGAAWGMNGLDYQGLTCSLAAIRPGIPGRYQRENAACALAAAELLAGLGFTNDTATLRCGIEAAFWPGRMELFPGPPRILLDGAHNPDGAAALAAAVDELPRQRLLLVVGIMEDKDLEGILAPLLPKADLVVAVAASLPRTVAPELIVSFCRWRGIPARAAGDVASGLALTAEQAGSGDLILVCGSLYIVGEARAHLFSRTSEPFQG